MNNKHAIAGLWSLSIIAALFIGSSMQTLETTTQSSQALQINPAKNTDCNSCETALSSSHKLNSTITKPSQDTKNISHSVILGDLAEELEITVSKDSYNIYDKYKGIAKSWDKIKLLSENELYALYDLIKENSENGVNRNIANMIYTRLADINPVKALDHIYDNKKHHAMYGVMNHWCKKDPFAAFKWTINNEEQIPSNYNFEHIIFKNMAQMDAGKAIESLESLDSAKRYNALNGILKTVDSSEEYKTIASIISLKDGCDRQVEAVFYNWALKDPQEALAWLGNIDDDKQRCKAEKKIKQGWMRSNPAVASKWIMANSTDKLKAMQEVIHGWGWKDGKKAFEFVDNQKIDDKDKAYDALVSRYSWNDSDIAIKALDKICDEEKRKQAVYKVYRSLKHRKQAKAEEFINSRTELTATEKEEFINKRR
ncbi:MAG: hypothetical protein MK132_27110 [Lentisphaerales bacterium]|nr:hypothetical protein [Lentisphaerales bacterium]